MIREQKSGLAVNREQRVPANRFDLEQALTGIVGEQSKRNWRTLTQELGERGLTVSELMSSKALDVCAEPVLQLLADDNDYITLSELVVLGQYRQAIEGDTKAAVFVRDTAGGKPATEVSVQRNEGGLASMTDEELRKLLGAIEGAATPTTDNTIAEE